MHRIFSITLLSCLVACLANADSVAATAGELFGAQLTLQEPVRLAELLEDPDGFGDAPVLLHGELVDVCQRKGCWTVLRDGEAHVRIRFRGYAFFIPKDARGREAFVQGHPKVSLLSERDARHYEAESLGGDPSRIVGPQREVGFEATGVRILAAN